MDDTKLKALERHWETSGKDEDAAREIYRNDAVLDFPQSGECFEGVESFKFGAVSTSRTLSSIFARSLTENDFVVAENLISYNGEPWMFSVSCCTSRATTSHTNTSTFRRGGRRLNGARNGAPRRQRTHQWRRSDSSNRPEHHRSRSASDSKGSTCSPKGRMVNVTITKTALSCHFATSRRWLTPLL